MNTRTKANVVKPWSEISEQYTVLLKNVNSRDAYVYATAFEEDAKAFPRMDKHDKRQFRLAVDCWTLVEERPEAEFKVGDRVQLVNLNSSSYGSKYTADDSNPLYGYGEVIEARRFGSLPISVKWNTGTRNAYHKGNLKLGEPKVEEPVEEPTDPSKFVVGDRVKLVDITDVNGDKFQQGASNRLGECGVIHGIGTNPYLPFRVKWDNGTRNSYRALNLELLAVVGEDPTNPWNKQSGGTHYTKLAEQPLQRTLRVKGYDAFAGACYTKVNKYMDRVKDDEAGQLAKAAHVLELWAYEAAKR